MTLKLENLEKRIKSLEKEKYLDFFILLVLYGSLLNIGVMFLNDGKMPVRTYTDNPDYIPFEDYSEVDKGYLGDIIHLKDIGYFSVGDVLIFIGYAFILGMVIKGIYGFIVRRLKR